MMAGAELEVPIKFPSMCAAGNEGPSHVVSVSFPLLASVGAQVGDRARSQYRRGGRRPMFIQLEHL